MSLIATAAAASAASPTVNLFTHGHKKGSHAGAKDGTASSSTQGPATTQSLLSSLFESIEQVMGISLTAPPRAVSATTPAAGAVTATAGPATTPNANTSFSGIGAHINTKA
jgi:type IV secretory pathway ATPase VirB11/archaellum biosynthesis ATPase